MHRLPGLRPGLPGGGHPGPAHPARRAWSPRALALVVLGLFLALTYLATISGHWQSRLGLDQFRANLGRIDRLEHPR